MKKPLIRVPLKYAFFGGILAFVLIVILHYFGSTHPQLYPIFLDFRILLFGVFIYFSIREFKDVENGGILHFWQGMAVGILCYLGIAWLVALGIIGLGEIDPGYLERYISETTDILLSNKADVIEKVGEEAFNAQIEALPSTTIFALAVDYFLKSMFIGLFLTIIISVILRKQPKN
jgi:hypothetical protein